MKAKVIKLQEKKSKFGGSFYYLFMKDDKGQSYKTCLYPQYRNFNRWRIIVNNAKQGIDTWMDGLNIKNQKSKMIDADSPVKIVAGE